MMERETFSASSGSCARGAQAGGTLGVTDIGLGGVGRWQEGRSRGWEAGRLWMGQQVSAWPDSSS